MTITEDRFQSLIGRFQTLQKDLDIMQREYFQTYTYHGNKCVFWLRISMEGLFKVIKEVKKTDKTLVRWHHASPALKGALRLILVDRRTDAVIAKGTRKLKSKVSTVEAKFKTADEACNEGVDAASRLGKRLLSFSVSSVGEASEEALEARSAYSESRAQVEKNIKSQQARKNTMAIEVAATSTSIQQLRLEHSQAQADRDFCAASSLGSLGLAAASGLVALLYPPSLLAAGSLLAVSAGTGGAALNLDSRMSNLESQREKFTRELASHEASIEALKVELATLDAERQTHAKTIEMIEELQARTGVIRKEIEEKLDQLGAVQLVLHNIHTKLENIIWQLDECQYVETRKDIGRKLRSILNSIYGLGEKEVLSLRGDQFAKAMCALSEIDEKTKEVLDIAKLVQKS